MTGSSAGSGDRFGHGGQEDQGREVTSFPDYTAVTQSGNGQLGIPGDASCTYDVSGHCMSLSVAGHSNTDAYPEWRGEG